MERYDYRKAITENIISVITDEDYYKPESGESREDYAERLRDSLWCCDSVTGNGSGSYTFSAWRAEEYICHNLDLLAEAVEEFGTVNILHDGAEACDVTIRCYLLSECIETALDELWGKIGREEENDRDTDED